MANETKTQGTLKVLAAGQHVERAAIATDGTVNVHHGKAQLQSVDVADVDLLLSFADGSYVVIPNGALEAISGTPHAVTFNDGKGNLDDLFKLAGTTVAAKAGSLRLVSENIDAAKPPSDETTPPEQAPTTELPAPPAPLVKVGAGIAADSGKGPGHGTGAGTGISLSNGEVPEQVQPVPIMEPPYYSSGTPQEAVKVAAPNLFDALSSPPTVSAALFTSSSFKLTGITGTPSGAWIAPPGALPTDPTYSADRAVYAEQLAIRSAPGAQAERATITGTGIADSIIHNSAFSATQSQWVMNLHLDTTNFNTITKIVVTVNGAYTSIPGFDIQGDGVTHVAGTNQWLVDPTAVASLLTQGLNLNIVYNVSDDANYLTSAATVLSSSITVSGTHTENGTTVTPDVTTSFQMVSSNAVSQEDYTVPVSDPIYGTNMMVLPRSGVGYDIYAGAGDDIVSSGAGADMIKGEAGNDTLDGGSGNDLINGGAGADTLIGGAGIDTATYADANQGIGVTAALDGSVAGAAGSESYGDTFASIENLVGTKYDDTLVGNSVVNVLTGGAGNDVLEGRGGADTIDGGAGVDTASYAHAISGVSASLLTATGTGASTSESFGDTLISIENLTGSAYGDILEGDANANVLDGGAGNDTLTGGAGADVLIGGDGNDTASYATSKLGLTVSLTPNTVIQTGDAAGDTFASVENLAGSAFNDTLIGNGSDNTLSGGAGNDVLEGRVGADTLQGGDGSDTASYAHAGGAVRASLIDASSNVGTDAIFDSYSSIENLIGSDYNDTLIGDGGVNEITGGAGADTLEGLEGADILDGGNGSNTASYASAAVIVGAGGALLGVTASLSAAESNTGDAQGDVYLNIQNLLGSNYNDTLTGDGGDNTLTGGAGNDVLEGLAGADELKGGTGIDTASYAAAGTSIQASLADAATNSGTDAQNDSYDSIENLTGGALGDTLVGDGGINTLAGGTGDDVLEGLAGADALIGGGDTNTASFAHSGLADYAIKFATTAAGTGVAASLTTNFLHGDAFAQTGDAQGDTYSGIANLIGSNYADVLVGDAAANAISGGAGDDTLEGMGGADVLDGGLGTNTASYNHASAQAGGVGVLASLDANHGSNTGEALGDTYFNIKNLIGSSYDDQLIGNETDNTLDGGQGNDTLEGRAGADHLIGGVGADVNNTASYAHSALPSGSSSLVISLLNTAANPVNTGDAAGDTYDHIRHIIGSDYSDTITGDSYGNTLNGGLGDDLLDGGRGDVNGDSFIGGGGADTVTYAASGGVTASLTIDFSSGQSPQQTGDATGDSFAGIENLIGATAFANTLIGDGAANILTGGDSDDVLEGMANGDALVGGLGNDTASYAHYAVNAGAGLTASLTATLSGPTFHISGDAVGDSYSSIENLLGSEGNDTLIGSTDTQYLHQGGDPLNPFVVNNILAGGNGDDVLEGLSGADVLLGGYGTDTASYAHAASGVIASLTANVAVGYGTANSSFTAGVTPDQSAAAAGDARGDTYLGVENLLGSSFADTLIGDAGDNIIDGGLIGGGGDVLEGMAGADQLIGSNLHDTASYEHATDGVKASLSDLSVALAGIHTQDTSFVSAGHAAGDSYVHIEDMVGSSYDDTLIGSSAINTLFGGGGDDVLEGIGGHDVYDGGSGINTVSYAHAVTGAVASLLPASQSSNDGSAVGDTYTLIQNLTGSDYADTLTGDGGVNTLIGGQGDDILNGGINSVLGVSSAGDTLDGGDGNDILTSDGIGAARLYGGTGDDKFILTGDDTQVDQIYGGANSALGVSTAGDTIVWSATTYNRIDVDMSNHTLYVRSPVGGTNVIFSNIENFTVTGNNTIYLYADNYSNIIDATANGAGNIDYVDYRYALGSISAGLSSVTTVTAGYVDGLGAAHNAVIAIGAGSTPTGTVTGGSSVLDTLTGNTWSGVGDTLKGIEYIYGSNYADNLVGNDNNNSIQGALGADYINGGAGTDTVNLDSYRSQTVVASLLNASTNKTMGIVMSDTAQGDTYVSIENLYSSGANDTLFGNSGNNTLYGNGVMEGLGGSDYIYGLNNGTTATASYQHAGDARVSSTSGTGVIANLYGAFTQGPALTGDAGDATGDTYTNIYNLIGSDYADTLIGNNANNVITGGAGNDVLEGMGGVDQLRGGAGTDTASYAHATDLVVADMGNTGTYTTVGDAAGDTFSGIEDIIGSKFADTLYGDGGDNVITGGAGNDKIDGAGGFNTASYADIALGQGGVVANLSTSSAVSTADGTDTLNNIQGLLGSINNDTLTGDSHDNVIEGGKGTNELDGGTGSDTASYSTALGGVTVSLAATGAQDTYGAGIDTLTRFENLTGSANNDTLTGDSNSNVIDGGLGNDTLLGGANTDTGIGDTVTYKSATAGVTVSLATPAAQSTGGSGTDTLSGFENLTGSDYNDTLTGDNGRNIVSGGAGDDLLLANASGASLSAGDTLSGGDGTDTVSYANSGPVTVTINGAAQHNSVTDVLSGIENLIGSANADIIFGDVNNNLIDGGWGDDNLTGGGGVDTVTYANAGTLGVTVALASYSSSGYGSDILHGFANVIGSAGSDVITGDGNSNVIEGGLGDDILSGGGTIGTGNYDTVSYSTASGAVTVDLSHLATNLNHGMATGAAGNDTLSGFVNAIGSGYNDVLMSSAGTAANTLDGGLGDDTLIGGGGADALIGGLGDDTASYQTAAGPVAISLGRGGLTAAGDAIGDTFNGIENIVGSTYADTLYGSTGNNTITGYGGNDIIYGADGNDVIYANRGHVSAYGENNNDTFYVSVKTENLPSAIDGGNRDAGYVQNHGGNVMVLQDLVDHGSFSMSSLNTAAAGVTPTVRYIDTVNIHDGASTAITMTATDINNLVNANGSNATPGIGAQIYVTADNGDTLNLALAANETQAVSSTTSLADGSTYTDYTIFNAAMATVAQVHWHATA